MKTTDIFTKSFCFILVIVMILAAAEISDRDEKSGKKYRFAGLGDKVYLCAEPLLNRNAENNHR